MLEQNLIKMYEKSFRENRELPALSDYFKKEKFTYFQMAQEIAKLHMLFAEAKIRPGDKIALIGRNNARWCIAYIATITYGAVIVPILQDFNDNDIHHIINHSGSKMLFCGDASWDKIDTDNVQDIMAVFSLTDFRCIFERKDTSLTHYYKDIEKHFRKRYRKRFRVEDIKYRDVPNDQVILLNYTSGTTGFSKGVMLTVNNLTGNVAFCMGQNIRKRKSNVLSFLPLAHAYGCLVDLLLSLAAGAHMTLLGAIPAPKILIEALQEVRPEVICCVPLILEKICRKQVFPMLGKGFMKVALKLPLLDEAIYATIRKKLLETFGGNIEQFIVGGAPLNREVEDFLVRIKFPFTVGYGMTECAPLISYVHTNGYKPTSCGMVLHGYMEARIDSADPHNIPGEILTRGENVMVGYYRNQAATDAVLEADGWLHTGDIGTMDPDGTLYIRGRSKSMILGPNGQNIYPEEIESKLNNMYCVNESLVIERDGKLVALVYPDYEQADADGIRSAGLQQVMNDNLKELNTMVSSYEKVASIVLYPNEFEKTPKKSIKRYLYEVSI